MGNLSTVKKADINESCLNQSIRQKIARCFVTGKKFYGRSLHLLSIKGGRSHTRPIITDFLNLVQLNKKPAIANGFRGLLWIVLDYVLVEMRGIEPLASALRTPRSPS